MELISVPLVTGFLSHLLLIFVRLGLNVQQKCPFKPPEHLCEGGQTKIT